MSDATTARLAVLCDYPEEGWRSMDLVAEMLLSAVDRGPSNRAWSATRVCPPFMRRFSRVPVFGNAGTAQNADRLLNRLHNYPRYVRRYVAGRFDAYHLADHSYSQLVHELPADRTGVFCHDLDTFQCLLEPSQRPRPRWFRAMARRILGGMQKAAVVYHATGFVRDEIVRHGLIDPARLVCAPLGVSPEFTAAVRDGADEAFLPSPIQECRGRSFLLHVGTCIPRKRIDVLLDVFAAVRVKEPDLRLVQVGGMWTGEQLAQIVRLGIGRDVVQLRGLTREQIATVYRAAAVVLQPSEAEGFGLPVVEALACGAAVVASDIPALREVGGTAVEYCSVGAAESWVGTVSRLLAGGSAAASRAGRLEWSARYSWEAHAKSVLEAYDRLSR